MIPAIHGALNFPRVAGDAFDPTSISGYDQHVIAGALDGDYNDGDTINSSFTDESGNYTFSIQGTPTLEKNELNGESIIRFTGSSDNIRNVGENTTYSNTLSIVYVVKGTTSATQEFMFRSSLADIYGLVRTDGDLNFRVSNDTLTLTAGDFAPTPAYTNWWIVIYVADLPNGTFDIYINDVTAQGTASGTGDSTNIPAQYSNIPSNTGSRNWDVAEWIQYNGHVLTSQEISDLFTYFGDKYDITVTT